jgi:hypothetical protein
MLANVQPTHQHDTVDAGRPIFFFSYILLSLYRVPPTGSREEERERTIQLAEMTAARMGAAVRNDAVISKTQPSTSCQGACRGTAAQQTATFNTSEDTVHWMACQ